MILIADSGSTKTNWALLQDAETVHTFTTPGFNPNYAAPDSFAAALRDAFDEKYNKAVSDVFYYGSGAGSPRNDAILREVLSDRFAGARVEVFNDLMAACRGLAGDRPGVVCILGTGSNACTYDGEHMSQDQFSLGYLLGDEGSGFALGKRMITAFLYEQMPAELRTSFFASYPVSREDVLQMAYHQESPNKQIARFSRFCSKYADHPWMEEQITAEMELFYQAFLLRSEGHSLPVHATGSVAAAFEKQFMHVCRRHGRNIGQILADPLPGLILFHQKKNGTCFQE